MVRTSESGLGLGLGKAVEVRPPARGVALTSLRRGEVGVICLSEGEGGLEGDEAAMLRAMGLGERVRVRMCRVGEPVVVALGTMEGRNCDCHGHCRIGLARGLAERVRVVVGGDGGVSG